MKSRGLIPFILCDFRDFRCYDALVIIHYSLIVFFIGSQVSNQCPVQAESYQVDEYFFMI